MTDANAQQLVLTDSSGGSVLAQALPGAIQDVSVANLRGSRAVADLVQRISPLSEFLRDHKPGTATITLARLAWDLIVRWPATAAAHGFQVAKGVVTWKGFTLRAENSVPRYKSAREAWEER